MNRRRFVFWLGFGLFTLGEKLRFPALDALAAAAMGDGGTVGASTATPIHWTVAENKTWRWFEREEFVHGKWKLVGITAPVHKRTGDVHIGEGGYLDDDTVPVEVRTGAKSETTALPPDVAAQYAARRATEKRRSRHGRPPSKWLRSLNAQELRIWLKTIDVPEADVSGMTYWEHLTRDHSFDAAKIDGLSEEEQAKLHAAAHYGY